MALDAPPPVAHRIAADLLDMARWDPGDPALVMELLYVVLPDFSSHWGLIIVRGEHITTGETLQLAQSVCTALLYTCISYLYMRSCIHAIDVVSTNRRGS